MLGEEIENAREYPERFHITQRIVYGQTTALDASAVLVVADFPVLSTQ